MSGPTGGSSEHVGTLQLTARGLPVRAAKTHPTAIAIDGEDLVYIQGGIVAAVPR